MGDAVLALLVLWGAASLMVGWMGSRARRRRPLPPTRHVRRVRLDLGG